MKNTILQKGARLMVAGFASLTLVTGTAAFAQAAANDDSGNAAASGSISASNQANEQNVGGTTWQADNNAATNKANSGVAGYDNAGGVGPSGFGGTGYGGSYGGSSWGWLGLIGLLGLFGLRGANAENRMRAQPRQA